MRRANPHEQSWQEPHIGSAECTGQKLYHFFTEFYRFEKIRVSWSTICCRGSELAWSSSGVIKVALIAQEGQSVNRNIAEKGDFCYTYAAGQERD
jgi:hypothetical protein